MWITFFWVCFGVGAGFVILSFVFGEIFGFFGGGSADCSAGGGSTAATECPSVGGGNSAVSPFMPKIIALFLTIFGGAGLLLGRTALQWFVVLPLAVLAGLCVAFVVFRFVVLPLHKRQNTSVRSTASFVGSSAVVVETIRQGGYGEITYSARGNSFSAPAKAESGEGIKRGTTVRIVYIEDGTFYVSEE